MAFKFGVCNPCCRPAHTLAARVFGDFGIAADIGGVLCKADVAFFANEYDDDTFVFHQSMAPIMLAWDGGDEWSTSNTTSGGLQNIWGNSYNNGAMPGTATARMTGYSTLLSPSGSDWELTHLFTLESAVAKSCSYRLVHPGDIDRTPGAENRFYFAGCDGGTLYTLTGLATSADYARVIFKRVITPQSAPLPKLLYCSVASECPTLDGLVVTMDRKLLFPTIGDTDGHDIHAYLLYHGSATVAVSEGTPCTVRPKINWKRTLPWRFNHIWSPVSFLSPVYAHFGNTIQNGTVLSGSAFEPVSLVSPSEAEPIDNDDHALLILGCSPNFLSSYHFDE